MCVVSMVMDHYKDKWDHLPGIATGVTYPNNWPPLQSTPNQPTSIQIAPPITREEFDQLRNDVLEMKELVKRALKYDQDTNQADCENEEKVALVRKVAEMVGVSLDDIFPKT
jgi:hypothetical protein